MDHLKIHILKNLRDNIRTRQKNFIIQSDFFAQFPNYFSNPIETNSANTAWLAFPLLIKKNAPFSRREFQIYLEKRNIQTRVVFTGNILRQPMCKHIEKRVVAEGYPNSDAIMERGVLLPLHHGMTPSMFSRFQAVVKEFLIQHE